MNLDFIQEFVEAALAEWACKESLKYKNLVFISFNGIEPEIVEILIEKWHENLVLNKLLNWGFRL